MLMGLGLFVFDMASLPFQDLQRRRDWRHEQSPRLLARAASQFLGPGADDITIQGNLVPEIAGKASSLDQLAEMADAGDEYGLVDGDGNILGFYKIRQLDTRSQILMDNGIARKIDFAIELQRVD